MLNKKHHKNSTLSITKNSFYLRFDLVIVVISFLALLFELFKINTGIVNIIILLTVSIIGLLPVLVSAAKALWYRKPTIDLLASIALIFALLAHEWSSAIFINLMLAFARLFARYTENRTEKSIKSLLKLRPTQAHVLIGGKLVETDIEKIKVGDLIVVESGERIAIDGIVESGEASIDQSSLTGESEPILKKSGDNVLSSTLNVSGSLIVKTTKVGADTTFAKILELVEKSQATKTPIASITENFTKWYIIVTLAGALMLFLFVHKLNLVLAVLLVTCADDLAVAIPLAFTAAIGAAARHGIIIKGGSFLEGLAKVKTMVFDKTGTLTDGKMKVKSFKTFNNYPKEKFLAIMGAIESDSNHPVAKAICKFIDEKKIKCFSSEDFHEEPGYGIMGDINNEQILSGRTQFLEDNGVIFSKEEKDILREEALQHNGVVVLSVNRKPAGYFSLSGNIKNNAKETMEWLKKMGVNKLVMLTGDNEEIANYVAEKIGIDEYKANLMPQDKINILKGMINPKSKVVMVGDGVNDAAALAQSDIGIAMGAIGTDAAIENADIVLMKDHLSSIIDVMKLNRETMRTVYQNIVLWAIIQILGLALVFNNILNPSGAAAYNFITDFIPIINSLKLFRIKLGK